MSDLPSPPTPKEADLRQLPYTPLYRAKLFNSRFDETENHAAWRCAVVLWLRSWEQVPAGSLPSEDLAIRRLLGVLALSVRWNKIKLIALHGWYQCNDGRLYHRVIAETVNTAWDSVLKRKARTANARAARLNGRSVTGNVTDNVTGSNITEHNGTPLPPATRGQSQYRNGRRNGSNGLHSIGSVMDSTESRWRARLESFQKSGAWLPMYGPAPGEPGCEAPGALLSEITGLGGG